MLLCFCEKIFDKKKNKKYHKSLIKGRNLIIINIRFFFSILTSKFILLIIKFGLKIDARALLNMKF